MFEKFFKVTDTSPYKAQTIESLRNKTKLDNLLVDFAQENDIQDCGISGVDIFAEASEHNIDKFGRQLGAKVYGNGFLKFRVNSKINKLWRERKAQSGITNVGDVWWGLVLGIVGRHRYKNFEFNGEVYLKFEADIDFKTPEGLVEINGSEFYNVLEAKVSGLKAVS